MLLPEYPVSDVAQVIVDTDTDNPRVLLDPTNGSNSEFDWTENGVLIRRRGQFVLFEDRFNASYGKWTDRRQSIQVSYDHGYDPIPADLQIVCVTAAARTWAQDGATQETTGTYTAMYAGQPGTLTPDEKRVLDRYRSRRKH